MKPSVRFDRYVFDPSTGRLWSGRREIRLTPKAASVLAALVTSEGQLVTREELFASIWEGAAVSDDALTSCVQELRRALMDDAKHPRFIETRHRRGYRFVAAVEPAGPEEWAEGASAPTEDASIAVLAFTDMSPDRDQDYFCEGLAEELIDVLTHIDGLRVAARSSSFQFRGPAADVRAVGQRLGVATLLEGSVRKTGDRLRITVQLVEAATGYHRWSQRFDRTLDDVFAIQEEIAESVAISLRGVLTPKERKALRRPETASRTYEAYLRGRQHLHRLGQADLQRSGELFEKAIGLDPDYAPAWAGLAESHAILYEWCGARPEDLHGAERASRRALELSPDLAEAHVARGLALSLAQKNGEVVREFEEAIRINPRLFDAYYNYARACFARGEMARSAELFRKAADVRAEDFQSAILLGQTLRMLGRVEEADEAEQEGIDRVRRTLALNPLDGRALSLGSNALFCTGQRDLAMEWSRRALELYPDELSSLINGACLRAKAGMKEEALELLERVCERGWGKRQWMEQDPDYESLRDDPRFQKLLVAMR